MEKWKNMLKKRMQMRRKPGGGEIGVFIFAVGRTVAAPSPDITYRSSQYVPEELFIHML